MTCPGQRHDRSIGLLSSPEPADVDEDDGDEEAAAAAAALQRATDRETIFTLRKKLDTGVPTRFVAMVKAPGKEVLITVMEVRKKVFQTSPPNPN